MTAFLINSLSTLTSIICRVRYLDTYPPTIYMTEMYLAFCPAFGMTACPSQSHGSGASRGAGAAGTSSLLQAARPPPACQSRNHFFQNVNPQSTSSKDDFNPFRGA